MIIKKEVLLVLLLLLVIVLSGCSNVVSKDTTEVIDGITVDKSLGGVIICNKNFPCGNTDGICPEDFGAECKVEDPDCNK